MWRHQWELDIIEKWQVFFSSLRHPFLALPRDTYSIELNSKMRSRAGLCRPASSRIELNPHLLKTPEDFEATLVHELCHLSVVRRWFRTDPHGPKWKALMLHCGFKPQRCHKHEIPNLRSHKKWEYLCLCQRHQVSTRIHNKIQRGNNYKCISCGGELRVQTNKSQQILENSQL